MKLRDIRGRFTAGLFPLSNRRKVYLASMFFLLILALIGRVGENWVTKELQYIAAERVEAAEIAPAATIDEMKADVLQRLLECESPGDTLHTLPVIEDNNAAGTLARREIPSIGGYRFKVGTVIGYYKMQTGKELTPTEATLLALDIDHARDLASFIIFDTPENDKGIDNWHRCNVKHDLDTLISFIKNHSN